MKYRSPISQRNFIMPKKYKNTEKFQSITTRAWSDKQIKKWWKQVKNLSAPRGPQYESIKGHFKKYFNFSSI